MRKLGESDRAAWGHWLRLSFLRHPIVAYARRSWDVTAVRELRQPRRPSQDGAVLSAPRRRLPPLFLRSARRVRVGRGDLHRVRLLFLVRRQLGRARQGLHTVGRRAIWACRPNSTVVEIASNDGYLLQHFVALGIPNFGIEPAENVAEAAAKKGVETLVKFFGVSYGDGTRSGGPAGPICCWATTCWPKCPT